MASIDVPAAASPASRSTSGESITAPLVLSGAHPKTTVLDLVGGGHFPDEVVEDMRATAPAAAP